MSRPSAAQSNPAVAKTSKTSTKSDTSSSAIPCNPKKARNSKRFNDSSQVNQSYPLKTQKSKLQIDLKPTADECKKSSVKDLELESYPSDTQKCSLVTNECGIEECQQKSVERVKIEPVKLTFDSK